MTWYKEGTVNVTNGSNAVIGTGTAFISNSRVGDAFRGPDGNWYEVVNIASNTAMSISPNYQGPTVAAGTYSIAPMQGYVKESADALRGITNTYGTKLAALGTTGNYDVLPVTKGGTGGADAASARAGLGLGTAATANVASSNISGIPGDVLRVGDFGIGGAVPFLDVTDLNSIIKTGFFFCGSPINGPVTSNGWLTSCFLNDKYQSQVFIAFDTRYCYTRLKDNGNWTPWSITYTDLNTTKAADGTLKAI